MPQSQFSFSGETHSLAKGRALVLGTRTSGGGRGKKHVFIEVECQPEEAAAVQRALAVILRATVASTQRASNLRRFCLATWKRRTLSDQLDGP
jgi:hypothetical protein